MIMWGFIVAIGCLSLWEIFPLKHHDNRGEWRLVFPIGCFLGIVTILVGLILQAGAA
jgi:hypothetical protein